MASSEEVTSSRRFKDMDRVTIGVRIMYGEAQAHRLGLLPARWEAVGKKGLAKVHALCDMLGCRPAQNKLTISATVPGAVETIHNNRQFSNPLIPSVAKKVNQLTSEVLRGYGIKCIVMYLLPNSKLDLRDHPPWLAIHAYAGDPSLVGNALHSRIRTAISRKARTSAEICSTAAAASPPMPAAQVDASTSPIVPVSLLPIRLAMSTEPLNARSAAQLPEGSVRATDQSHPAALGANGRSPNLNEHEASSADTSDQSPSNFEHATPHLSFHRALSIASAMTQASSGPVSEAHLRTMSSTPAGPVSTSLKRPHSALARDDDSSTRPTKLRKVKESFPVTRSQTAQKNQPQPSSSRAMLPTRPPSAPAPAPAESREQFSVMQGLVRDLLAEKAMLIQANNACAAQIQVHVMQHQHLQREASQLPELHARAQVLQHSADTLRRELGGARVHVAELQATQRSYEEQLATERDEKRQLMARISELETKAAHVPALERDIQSQTNEVQNMRARLESVEDEQSSTLAQLREALGDENGIWDDAPLSMVLLAVEKELRQRVTVKREMYPAEEGAQASRLRLSALELEKQDVELVPALTGALFRIADMIGVV